MSTNEQKKNEIKQVRNKKYKTLIKNRFRKIEMFLKENKKDEKELKNIVSEAQRALDKASNKKIIHKNKAARKKSQLHQILNKSRGKETTVKEI